MIVVDILNSFAKLVSCLKEGVMLNALRFFFVYFQAKRYAFSLSSW
jgi:hypothetical protein